MRSSIFSPSYLGRLDDQKNINDRENELFRTHVFCGESIYAFLTVDRLINPTEFRNNVRYGWNHLHDTSRERSTYEDGRLVKSS